MRESPIEKYLRRGVIMVGGDCYKFVSPGRRSVTDRIVTMPGGRVYFVETKATGKGPSEAQEREHTKLRRLGFEVYVLNSFELVDQFIRMIQWPCKD